MDYRGDANGVETIKAYLPTNNFSVRVSSYHTKFEDWLWISVDVPNGEEKVEITSLELNRDGEIDYFSTSYVWGEREWGRQDARYAVTEKWVIRFARSEKLEGKYRQCWKTYPIWPRFLAFEFKPEAFENAKELCLKAGYPFRAPVRD